MPSSPSRVLVGTFVHLCMYRAYWKLSSNTSQCLGRELPYLAASVHWHEVQKSVSRVPGHGGLLGNETADAHTRGAALLGNATSHSVWVAMFMPGFTLLAWCCARTYGQQLHSETDRAKTSKFAATRNHCDVPFIALRIRQECTLLTNKETIYIFLTLRDAVCVCCSNTLNVILLSDNTATISSYYLSFTLLCSYGFMIHMG